jgi:hypothetical protein
MSTGRQRKGAIEGRFRYTGFAFGSVTLEVDSEIDLKNKELEGNGRGRRHRPIRRKPSSSASVIV